MPKSYWEKIVADSVEDVQSGISSLQKAAAYYGVPRGTIRDQVPCILTSGRSAGHQTALPAEVEHQIASELQDAALIPIVWQVKTGLMGSTKGTDCSLFCFVPTPEQH